VLVCSRAALIYKLRQLRNCGLWHPSKIYDVKSISSSHGEHRARISWNLCLECSPKYWLTVADRLQWNSKGSPKFVYLVPRVSSGFYFWLNIQISKSSRHTMLPPLISLQLLIKALLLLPNYYRFYLCVCNKIKILSLLYFGCPVADKILEAWDLGFWRHHYFVKTSKKQNFAYRQSPEKQYFCKSKIMSTPKRVVIPVDGSTHSESAFDCKW